MIISHVWKNIIYYLPVEKLLKKTTVPCTYVYMCVYVFVRMDQQATVS